MNTETGGEPMHIVERALIFAAEAHQGAFRKQTTIPYILHPAEVCAIATTMTQDPEILAAALLHDVAEDTEYSLEDIRRIFGSRIADLVEADTEKSYPDQKKSKTWQKRKEDSLAVLKDSSDIAVKILWLSDKLSSLRGIYARYVEVGDAVWKSFNQQNPEKQYWYYSTVLKYVSVLKEYPVYDEYRTLLRRIFRSKQAEGSK